MTRIIEESPGGSADLSRIAAQLRRAIHDDHRRHVRRHRVMVRVTLVASVAAAIAMGAVRVVSSMAPSAAQPADARALRRAVAALVPSTGTILHVVMTGTETTAARATASWRDATWTDYPTPGGDQGGFRQLITGPNGTEAETANFSVIHSTPNSGASTVAPAGGPYHGPFRDWQAQVYDPSTNTIYTGTDGESIPLHPQGGAARKGAPATLPSHALGCGPGLAPMGIPPNAPSSMFASVITGTPYLGPNPIETTPEMDAPSPPMPWTTEPGAELQSDLTYGCATIVGHPVINGHATVEIAGTAGSWTYYADASGYQPVELDYTGESGTRVTLRFDTYERLPAHGDSDLLNLAAQHPTATVDSSPSDYQATQTRLFPASSAYGTGNATEIKGP